MLHVLIAFLIYLLTVLPVQASYVFDGNDHIDSAANAVIGINDETFSWSCWIKVTATPSAQQAIITHATAITPPYRRTFLVQTPASSGWRFAFGENFGTAGGTWRYDTDLPLNTWIQIGVDYDGSSASNDPNLVVNGNIVAATETVTPSGGNFADDDTIRIGEDMGGTSDLVAKVAECAFYTTRLTVGNWATLGSNYPSALSTNRLYYLPLLNNTTDTDGVTGAMTATGATADAADHPLLNRRRGSTPMVMQ